MKRRAPLLAACALAAAACGVVKSRPSAEAVRPGLQKEAEAFKADAEKMPALGLKTTWKIASVEVQEQADNDDRPFRGVVRFRIETEKQEPDGVVRSEAIEKTFNYVYDATAGKWTFGS
jgi:hypothetical protein